MVIQNVAPVCITDWSTGKSNACFLLFNDVPATKTSIVLVMDGWKNMQQ